MLTVKQIYKTIDAFAPFASQESWDNSGLLVGDLSQRADRILTALDISAPVIREAENCQVQLIVAHHPVIFSPIKCLPATSPVYQLAARGIAAICVHTPLDIAPEGLNGFAHTLCKEPLALEDHPVVLEPTWQDGRGFGWIDMSRYVWTPQALAIQLRQALGVSHVRYTKSQKQIRKIAYCSGSAASMLELAAEQGCNALITGDIKHDRWYAAEFLGISLFDCGHFGTERFAAQILRDHMQAAHPNAAVFCMPGEDPVTITVGDGVS